jgi:peptide/nickel transport system permease protein
MQSISSQVASPLLDNLHHLFLPGMILALDTVAGLTRYVRSSMLEVLRQECIHTARAKG